MTHSVDDRDPIEVLADEFMQRHRSGDCPSISQFAKEHPECAQDILDLFPVVARIEQLKDKSGTGSHGASANVQGCVEYLGDFRILREIGRGGMGIVYEAEQQSLARRVALKVLNGSTATSKNQVLRFQREAESAARLHHTNIVPIYGVGRDADLNFYAMQLIDGVGLDAVVTALAAENPIYADGTSGRTSQAAQIAADALCSGEYLQPCKLTSDRVNSAPAQLEEPSPTNHEAITDVRLRPLGKSYWRSVARIAADVAQALDFAHRHGTLHRDIKPSNLLLDREGNVWITDFGLAKHETGMALTDTGDMIGTLRYMAPEQLYGQADARSDVYSLGLTLYELLTLQPAFGENNYGALVRQKTNGEVPAPRSLNPGIPRDLETIVLTACAVAPSHRYATAGEVAAELRRFLEERPIAARRVGAPERLWRWCRRNPAIASVSAAAATLLIVVAVVSVIGFLSTRAALIESQSARQTATQAQSRAESNLNLAIKAFESIFDNVALRGVPQSLDLELDSEDAPRFESTLTRADAELLRSLLSFYEQFAAQNVEDIELQAKTADAYHRIGQIHQRLGNSDEAQSSYDRALSMYDRLLEQFPKRIDLLGGKAQLLTSRADLLAATMRPLHELLAERQKAIDLLSNQPAEIAALPSIRFTLAKAYDIAPPPYMRRSFVGPEAVPLPDGARPVSGTLPPNPDGSRLDPDQTRGGPGGPFFPPPPGEPRRMTGPPPRDPREMFAVIETSLQRAQDILEELVAEHSGNLEYRFALAQVQQHRLFHYSVTNQPARAVAALRQATSILDQLVELFPQNPSYLVELADTLSVISGPLGSLTEEEAEQNLRRAIDYSLQLTTAFPSMPEYQVLLSAAYRKLGRLLRARRDYLGAEENLMLACQRLERLATRDERQSYLPLASVLTNLELAEVQRTRGEEEDHLSALEASRATLEKAIVSLPGDAELERNPFLGRLKATLYQSLAATCRALNDDAAAADAEQKAGDTSPDPLRLPFFRPDTPPPPGP